MDKQQPPEHSGANVASIDYMVDEKGSRVHVPDDSELQVATDAQPTVGATGPTNWWRLGLIGLGIVAFTLLLLQLLGGRTGTDVIPGTPVSAPQPLAAPPN
jgi:hypothetical protein